MTPFATIGEFSEWFAVNADGACCVLYHQRRRLQVWWAGENLAWEVVGLNALSGSP